MVCSLSKLSSVGGKNKQAIKVHVLLLCNYYCKVVIHV
uniref:Uncharacterized protein n=1 Tax=Anguilla anguilla TaxID=7936 RepID=A0A0E9T2Z0_ANGAN